MKKILTLFLLLSPSFLLARPSDKDQLQRAMQDIVMLEEEVVRLNSQKRALNKIEHAMNDLKHEMKKYEKRKKDGFFVSWIYRPLVFIASICTIMLTAVVIYFYISPYNALKKWGMSEEHIQNDLGFEEPSNNSRPNNNNSILRRSNNSRLINNNNIILRRSNNSSLIDNNNSEQGMSQKVFGTFKNLFSSESNSNSFNQPNMDEQNTGFRFNPNTSKIEKSSIIEHNSDDDFD